MTTLDIKRIRLGKKDLTTCKYEYIAPPPENEEKGYVIVKDEEKVYILRVITWREYERIIKRARLWGPQPLGDGWIVTDKGKLLVCLVTEEYKTFEDAIEFVEKLRKEN